MKIKEAQTIANNWIRVVELQLSRVELSDDDWDLLDQLSTLPRKDPVTAWTIIKAIVATAPSQQVLEQLGAGPIENLIRYAGDAFFNRISEESATSRNLLIALDQVDICPDDWPRMDDYLKLIEQ